MKFKSLSVWIQDSSGKHLPEYGTSEVDENTIECWIPSTEGANFGIGFKSLEESEDQLDLRCDPRLDGVPMTGMIISDQNEHTIRQQVISASTARLFSFGKRNTTDQEKVAPSKNKPQDLNTIRTTLQWGRGGESKTYSEFYIPKENGIIHEKAAKKGHVGSAGLGAITQIGYTPKTVSWKVDNKLPSVVFVFRYGPEDWLQARGIMPSENPLSVKRERDATPELIDLDDLDTDDDDIIIIKHLVPAPSTQSNKRRKVGDGDVKPELDS